jgi:hypothetical protein
VYGLTRGTLTLLGAALAGFLVWLAFEVVDDNLGDYWAALGLLAAAGLSVALSQLLGGWTKWGLPQLSTGVFLLAFLPALVVVGWVALATQPDAGWLQGETHDWAGDIGLGDLLDDLGRALPVLAFGLGLVFGLTFDTTGPRTEPLVRRRRTTAERPAASAAHPLASSSRTAREGARPLPEPKPEPAQEAGTPVAPQPEPEPPPERPPEPRPEAPPEEERRRNEAD